MGGRRTNVEIEQAEDNLASLSAIEESVRILLARTQNILDREEGRRILEAVERIRSREQARRARAREAWK